MPASTLSSAMWIVGIAFFADAAPTLTPTPTTAADANANADTAANADADNAVDKGLCRRLHRHRQCVLSAY
jgi:hypothetical protein